MYVYYYYSMAHGFFLLFFFSKYTSLSSGNPTHAGEHVSGVPNSELLYFLYILSIQSYWTEWSHNIEPTYLFPYDLTAAIEILK